MHRIDSANYTTVGGKRRYTGTPPRTVLGADAHNAYQEELALTVEGAGLTLAASGTADESAGWGQLRQAVADFNSGAVRTEALRLRNASVITELANFNMGYVRHALRRILVLQIPAIAIVIASPTGKFEIKTNAGTPAAVPTTVRPQAISSAQVFFPLVFADSNNTGGSLCLGSFVPTTNIFEITPANGVNFTGTFQLLEQQVNLIGVAI